VQELDAAWNARDAVRFSAVFAEEGNFQFPVEGVALRGRDEIQAHYANLFATFPPDLRHVTTTGKRTSLVRHPAVDFEVSILGTDPRPARRRLLLSTTAVGSGGADGNGMAHPAGARVSGGQVTGRRNSGRHVSLHYRYGLARRSS